MSAEGKKGLPIGGCISELNCLSTRSTANEECIRDTQQHLREYGALIVRHDALLTRLSALEAREKVLREALKESRDILAMFGPAAFNILWCAINWNDHNFKEEVLRGKGKRAADLLGFDRLTGVDPVNKVIDRMEKSLDASDAALATGEAKP